jgi:hypothetical protein
MTGANEQPKRLRLISFKPVRKNSLIGFATIELPIGLKLLDVPVLVSNGKAWAALPAKPRIEDGRQKLDANGKPAYLPLLEWRSKELRERFSQRVVELVRTVHPEVFDDGDAP